MSAACQRKICAASGSRADYGILAPLLKEIRDDPSLSLQIAVTGSHLSETHGFTKNEILADMFEIGAEVPIPLGDDSPRGIANATAEAIKGFGNALHKLKPDILLILGDRYEIFAAAAAALFLRVPVAHLHGGELSEGAIDDSLRHCISKISHLHFCANEEYGRRLLQMGEDPAKVFCFGSPAIDSLDKENFPSRSELEDRIDMKLDSPFFLVTYHPETLSDSSPSDSFSRLLDALDQFPRHKILFTGHNADPGATGIARLCADYVKSNHERTRLQGSLGRSFYLSAVRECEAVVGNSSSGLIEVPHFKKPTVNVGHRQDGRLRALSVLDCEDSAPEICLAIRKAISSEFRPLLQKTSSPCGDGGSSPRIKETLKVFPLEKLKTKKFHDLRSENDECRRK